MGGAKSENAMPLNKDQHTSKVLPLKVAGHLLPTYSTVLKMGPLPRPFIQPLESNSSFIPKMPPPTYAEAEGWNDLQSMISCKSITTNR